MTFPSNLQSIFAACNGRDKSGPYKIGDKSLHEQFIARVVGAQFHCARGVGHVLHKNMNPTPPERQFSIQRFYSKPSSASVQEKKERTGILSIPSPLNTVEQLLQLFQDGSKIRFCRSLAKSF